MYKRQPLECKRKRPYFQWGGMGLAVGTAVVWGLVFLCAAGGVGPLSLGDADALALPAAALCLLAVLAFEAGRARGETALSRRTFYRWSIWALALAPARLAGVCGMVLLRRLFSGLNTSSAALLCLALDVCLPAGIYAAVCLGVWTALREKKSI